MAILGLRLRLAQIFIPITIVLLVFGWLFAHYLIMLLIDKQLNIQLVRVPTVSMANVG